MSTSIDATNSGGGGILSQLGGHGFFNFNVMLLLSTALQNFSGALIQTSAVQAQTTLQESELEVQLSNKGMAELQQDTNQLEYDTNQYNYYTDKGKKNKASEYQADITVDNTQFSMDLQVMNTNVETLQGLSQGSETASQMTTSSIQGLSSLFGIVSQLLSYISGLIQS